MKGKVKRRWRVSELHVTKFHKPRWIHWETEEPKISIVGNKIVWSAEISVDEKPLKPTTRKGRR